MTARIYDFASGAEIERVPVGGGFVLERPVLATRPAAGVAATGPALPAGPGADDRLVCHAGGLQGVRVRVTRSGVLGTVLGRHAGDGRLLVSQAGIRRFYHARDLDPIVRRT